MNKKHFHFKLSDKSVENIFKNPWKLTIFIGVFATIILCAVILIKVNSDQESIKKLNSQNHNVLNKPNPPTEDDYKKEVKNILGKYFIDRQNEKLDEKFCLSLVSKNLEQILNLRVPVAEKDVHLELVVLLDKESAYCKKQDSNAKINLNQRWKNFLNKYNWLSQ